MFAQKKELIFPVNFTIIFKLFLNSNLALVLWQVNLFEAFCGSNFTEGVWKWILSWSYFWVWKQVFQLGFLASAISCWDSNQSAVFLITYALFKKEKRNGQLFLLPFYGILRLKIGQRLLRQQSFKKVRFVPGCVCSVSWVWSAWYEKLTLPMIYAVCLIGVLQCLHLQNDSLRDAIVCSSSIGVFLFCLHQT